MRFTQSGAAYFRVLVVFCLLLFLVHARRRRPPRRKAQHCSRGTHDCHRDATCTDTRKSFRCYCKPGFSGDGKVCNDNDECSYDNGGCVHHCINEPGSYSCSCRPGFRLSTDKRNCEDINECLINNGGCSQHCINTIGSHFCGCKKGFSLDHRGTSCKYGDWCRLQMGCSHSCRASPGIPRTICSCPDGLYLLSNHKTCVRSCGHGNGGCHHVCTDTRHGPSCSCADAYSLASDNVTCIATCDVDNGGCDRECSDSPTGPKCTCPAGFNLHHNGKSCLDINECNRGLAGCSHQCENTIGSFECVCPSGYKVGNNRRTCIDVDECELETSCDHICENTPGSFICHCRQGYEKYGITHCADKNECAERHGGCSHSCTNSEGSYQCSCVLGFKLHPNQHDCIEDRRCVKLFPKAGLKLDCYVTSGGEQHCTAGCQDNGILLAGGQLLNVKSVNMSCGLTTGYEWKGLRENNLPRCAKMIVSPTYQRTARVVFLRENCEFDETRLEETRLALTKRLNSEKRFRCHNRCHVTHMHLFCGSKRRKYRRYLRKTNKLVMTAEFVFQVDAKKITAKCDAFCSAEKNWRRFNKSFKRLRKVVKRSKFYIQVHGKNYRTIKKSLKAEKRTHAICPNGTVFMNKTCVGCLPGSSMDQTTKTCVLCSKGTYQDVHGTLQCKPCPGRTAGSGQKGATSLQDCYNLCDPGTFSSTGIKPCQKCAIGTFQPDFGRITCVPCGGGLSTRQSGSKTFQQCLAKVKCKAGSHYSPISHSCQTCGLGFYQPKEGQQFCHACPGDTQTDFTGSTSILDCKNHTCGQFLAAKDSFGFLETPNYPGNYPNNVECVWKIQQEKHRRILIIVPQIDLSSDKCGDVLSMRKSKNAYSQVTFETCESRHRPIALTARSKKLWIQFKSDGNNTAKGFSIPFVTYDDDYQILIENIVKDSRLYSSKHQRIFKDRQVLHALLEVIASPNKYLKYYNVSHAMLPQSFFKLLTPKVSRFLYP